MSLINEAFQVLSTPQKRERFNEKYDDYMESLGIKEELKYEEGFSSDEDEAERAQTVEGNI